MMANIAQSYLATRETPGRLGNAHPQVAPYQDFRASDGFFMLAANNNDQFKRLCDTVGLPDLPDDDRFRDNADRVRNREALETLINGKMGANTRDYWMDELQQAGITVTSINTVADALDDPQAAARKSVWNIDHPTLGSVPVLASALQHMSRTPAQSLGHPPLLGEHTEEVLRNDLGIPNDEIQTLIADGVVTGRSDS